MEVRFARYKKSNEVSVEKTILTKPSPISEGIEQQGCQTYSYQAYRRPVSERVTAHVVQALRRILLAALCFEITT